MTNTSRREKLIQLYHNAPEAIQKLMRLDEMTTRNYVTAQEIVAKWGDLGYFVEDNTEDTSNYICFRLPNLSHSDIKKLSRTIDENSIAEIRRKTRTIHTLVITWSIIIFILLIFIGGMVLRVIDTVETHQPEIEMFMENLDRLEYMNPRW